MEEGSFLSSWGENKSLLCLGTGLPSTHCFYIRTVHALAGLPKRRNRARVLRLAHLQHQSRVAIIVHDLIQERDCQDHENEVGASSGGGIAGKKSDGSSENGKGHLLKEKKAV